jgi:hypothetical protein
MSIRPAICSEPSKTAKRAPPNGAAQHREGARSDAAHSINLFNSLIFNTFQNWHPICKCEIGHRATGNGALLSRFR